MQSGVSSSRLKGFRNLTPAQRWRKVVDTVGLGEDEAALLAGPGALLIETADGMIENVIGTFELPMAIAANFTVNSCDYIIPMVVEEPSIVAAASFMARIVRDCGGFEASATAPLMRAQIQIVGLSDPYGARLKILAERERIIAAANACDQVLVELGGGCRDIEVHIFTDTPVGAMTVLHLIVDVRDAMGANTVNTMAERVAPLIEDLTGGAVRLRILSNLADLRLARARVAITPAALAIKELSGEEIIDRMVEAYQFAATDPYRAATHNKGIMNGIDPLILATGNDWRAIEAGAHVWAVRKGHYSSLTTWERDKAGRLVGTLEIPMAVGIVGGATKTHPLAKLALKILNINSAAELAQLCAVLGLAQNMAAIRALATEGIQRGHMTLHARNIAIVAGAVGTEVDTVAKKLAAAQDVSVERARDLLATLRGS